MVLTWNEEPSTAQDYSYPSHADLANAGHKAAVVLQANKFVRESTRQDRIPNFLNAFPPDGQGNERSNLYLDRNTNTHTYYEDRLANTRTVLELAEQVEKSLWGPPVMKSQRLKSATNKSLLSNDTRFEVLRDSCTDAVGPGTYWIEGNNMGLMLPEQPTRGASPGKDPYRMSQSFISMPRPEVFPPSVSPDKVYISPEFQQEHDKSVAWHNMRPQSRASVQDYRYNARLSETAKQVPLDSEYPAGSTLNQCSQQVCIADVVEQGASPTHTFRTTQARLIHLPNQRTNDMRLTRPAPDDDSTKLGPGTYTPYTSLGSARRKTYRIFTAAQPNGIIGHGHTPASYQRYSRMAGTSAASRGASSAFQSTPRGRKSGPYTWATDSALVRGHWHVKK